jgi:hypothetical protein
VEDKLLEIRYSQARDIQENARLVQKPQWGIFQKRNIIRLVDSIKEGNDRTMRLLLYSLCFEDNLR